MDDTQFLARDGLQALFDVLRRHGLRTLAPQVRDGAIQYLDTDDATRLPFGQGDDQGPGRYRLERNGSPRCFAWATGPQALKPQLFHPREVLWQSTRDAQGGLAFEAAATEAQPLAVVGVRACDLAALALQDRHFLGQINDPYYAAHRDGLFVVAVHCTHPAATCFCASTGDGPRCGTGFDIALSELDDGFLVEIGSERGRAIAAELPLQSARTEQRRQADDEIAAAARAQLRGLPSRDLSEALFAHLNHPRWEDVGARCLACGNCTNVCPTCFCHAEQEAPRLDGDGSVHLREWDSCFSEGHSYLHGFVVRASTPHRYRQWLTHKLGTWHAQYGRSGCVGCGRCITWCPVGIDITVEAASICTDAPAGGDA